MLVWFRVVPEVVVVYRERGTGMREVVVCRLVDCELEGRVYPALHEVVPRRHLLMRRAGCGFRSHLMFLSCDEMGQLGQRGDVPVLEIGGNLVQTIQVAPCNEQRIL